MIIKSSLHPKTFANIPNSKNFSTVFSSESSDDFRLVIPDLRHFISKKFEIGFEKFEIYFENLNSIQPVKL